MIEQRSEKFLKENGVDDWGTYNVPPTPYKAEPANLMGGFFRHFADYGIRDMEFRQVFFPDDAGIHNVHIVIYSDAIFMVECVRDKVGDCAWEDNLKVWRVGCKHQYKSIPHEKFKHCEWLVCEKCGNKQFVDYGD